MRRMRSNVAKTGLTMESDDGGVAHGGRGPLPIAARGG